MNATISRKKMFAMSIGSAGVGLLLMLSAGAHAQTTTTPYMAPSTTMETTASTSVIIPAIVIPTSVSVPITVATSTSVTTVVPAIVTSPAASSPVVVNVDQYGNTLLRGTVVSVSGNSLTVNSWGGTWTINVTGGTQIESLSPNSTGNLGGINVGDLVGVIGIITSGQSWTVKATLVHDWTSVPGTAATLPTSASGGTSGTDTTSSTASLPAGEVLYTGSVSSISDGSLMLAGDDGNAYTVNIASDTTLWDTNRNPIDISAIQSGDSIRIDGTLSSDGTSIDAGVVRDTAR